MTWLPHGLAAVADACKFTESIFAKLRKVVCNLAVAVTVTLFDGTFAWNWPGAAVTVTDGATTSAACRPIARLK